MDIERLTKVQIVLLTLLVSFVTSIATGIVTVSLMDQAPPSIAQTVNRVIERTVQTVVPAAQTGAAAGQKILVVKESDLIAQAVDKVSPSIVRLFTTETDSPTFLGLGVVLSSSGVIAVDVSELGSLADATIALSDGTRVRAFVVSRDDHAGLAYLTAATSTPEKTLVWQPIVLSTTHATLGETVVALAGNTVARISDGIVTAMIPAADGAPQIIDTSVPESAIMFGSPLIDSDGNLVGVSTSVSRTSSVSGFVPASALGTSVEQAQ